MRQLHAFFSALFLAAACAEAASPSVQSFALTGIQDLIAKSVKIEPAEFKGRKAVRLLRDSQGEGLALLRDTQFGDGTIEADIAVKLTTPPGVPHPGYIGIAFRSRTDALHYDMFYLRPGNSDAADQAMRNHSVQYVSSPDFDWEKLRRNWPWVYESYAELQLETWTHMRIEVAGRQAKLYLNGSAKPAMIVETLKGEDLRGGVGLWGSMGQESYFSNLKITHGEPQTIENGAEAAGKWDIQCKTSSGPFTGSLILQRDGSQLSGTITTQLGADVPVAGTWRNGYFELTFPGVLPYRDKPRAPVTLAGWIDGSAGKGRMTMAGHAEGTWSLTKKQ
jgi:hypothetical protein